MMVHEGIALWTKNIAIITKKIVYLKYKMKIPMDKKKESQACNLAGLLVRKWQCESLAPTV